MHEFLYDYLWYEFLWSRNIKKAKLCYMDTDSFIVDIKIEDISGDITKDVDARLDTSNYELWIRQLLPKRKNKKVIVLMKDESGGKIMKLSALRTKTYNYLTGNNVSMELINQKRQKSVS